MERERWRTSSQNGQYLMPSASTGNIPRQFRSLQGMYYVVFSQGTYFHIEKYYILDILFTIVLYSVDGR